MRADARTRKTKRDRPLAAVGNLRSARLCWSFRRGCKRGVRFPLYSMT
jgi:hypothetical protein